MSESKIQKLVSIKILTMLATIFLTFMIANTSHAKLTYDKLIIKPFDTSKKTPGRVYNGTSIELSNVKLDGKPIGKNSISFEFGGGYGQKVRGIEFSSKLTFTNMPQKVSNGSYSDRFGYRFYISKTDSAKSSNIYKQLNPEDKLIFKAVCGALSDDVFVKNILKLIKNYSAYTYNIDARKYKKYWAGSSRLNETIKIANECNRGLKNTGPDKVKFVKKYSTKTLNTSRTTKLCGRITSGLILNYETFKVIQKNLKTLGLYNSEIDGAFGSGSCKALNKYLSSTNNNTGTFTGFHFQMLQRKVNVISYKNKKLVEEVIKKEGAISQTELKKAAILEAAKKEAAAIVEAAKKEAALIEAAKKDASAIVEADKKETNVTNELSASNILLADNISDEAAISPSTVIVEEKELKENIFQIEKLTELQEIALKADTFLMEYTKDQAGKLMRYKLRLTVKGSEIDTSLVSKSIFGFENSSSIDISMSIGSSQAALDFIIDEENTKINLHFSDEASVNKDFASNIPELILDASEISGAFLVRIIDDGSNNIQSGDFAQILERLDPKDVALVGAFCSVIQSISADKNTFIKSVTQNIPDESKDGFSSSPLVSDGVINIINSHATACVGELEKVNNTKASFDIPNLFDFDETGETLLENSSENILEKSRAELKIKEIAEQKRLAKQYAEEKRLAEEQRKKNKQRRLEEKRIADLAKVEKKKKEKEKLLAEKALLEKQLGKYPKMIGGKKLWISAEEFKKSGTSCAKFYNNESGMFVAKAFNSESTKILIYPGGKNEFKNSVKDENHTLRGGNKITSVENIIEFLNILKIGSSVQKTTYRISRDGNKITPISGQCIGCTGGVKYAFDKIIENKSPVYWCFNDL